MIRESARIARVEFSEELGTMANKWLAMHAEAKTFNYHF